MHVFCQPRKSPFVSIFSFLILCLGGYLPLAAQTQTQYQLSWPSLEEWNLTLYAQTPEGGSTPVSLIEFSVPYEDQRINETTQTRSFTAPYWFNPDGLCQTTVEIDTLAQIIFVRLQRPQHSPIAGEGLVCFVKGGGTSVILDDIHVRLKLEDLQFLYDSWYQILTISHLPQESSALRIVDAMGRIVYRKSFPAGHPDLKVSLSHLRLGVYWAQVWTASGGFKQHKFTK